MEKESNNKIGIVTTSAMVTVAIIFDLIGSIPIISIVSSVMSCLIFGTWFYFLGAGLVNPKKIATIGIGFLSKVIPGNIFPTTTIGVCALIFMQNHPVISNLAHKGLSTKKQNLNRQIRGFEQTSKKPSIQDVKKKEVPKETTAPEKKKPEGQEVKKTPNVQENLSTKEVRPVSIEEKTETPDKKELSSKENNSEDQKADYEKNKQNLKDIEYLQGKIPQRRFIKDIDVPAPYGENIDDELDLAA